MLRIHLSLIIVVIFFQIADLEGKPYSSTLTQNENFTLYLFE